LLEEKGKEITMNVLGNKRSEMKKRFKERRINSKAKGLG
jgi:hypothetical protein